MSPLQSLSNQPTVLPPGTWVRDLYQIKRPIGRGGFGQVYLATSGQNGRLVALKVSRPAFHDLTLKKRLEREAQIGQTLSSPRSVRVLDYGTDHRLGLCFLSMEYIEGEPLCDWLRDQTPLSTQQTLWVVDQVALALREAHAQGLIHRDIKPNNIMIMQRQERLNIKLIDWGIARWIDHPNLQELLTGNGIILGTAQYMAPEQAQRHPLSPQTDQYALAVSAFEMFCGTLPFSCARPWSLIQKHIHEPPPSLPSWVHNAPSVTLVLHKALSKDPQARFPSISDFAFALRDAATAPVTNPLSLSTLQTIRAALPLPPQPEPTREPEPVTALRSWLIVAIPALFVIFAGLLVRWLMEA